MQLDNGIDGRAWNKRQLRNTAIPCFKYMTNKVPNQAAL